MKALLSTCLVVIALMSSAPFVAPVHAQVDPNVDSLANSFKIASGSDLQGKIQKVINWLLGFLGLVAVVVIVYGGVQYILSAGDDKKAAVGKQTVVYAIIGLILVGISAVVVNSILSVLH